MGVFTLTGFVFFLAWFFVALYLSDHSGKIRNPGRAFFRSAVMYFGALSIGSLMSSAQVGSAATIVGFFPTSIQLGLSIAWGTTAVIWLIILAIVSAYYATPKGTSHGS